MKPHQPDYILIVSLAFLSILGLIVLTSASYFTGCEKFKDCYFFLKHQLLFGLLPGLAVFLFFFFFNHQHLKKIALPLLIFSLILSVAVFIPGIGLARGEARRWINIAGFVFQPSELLKFSFLIYLAAWLTKNQQTIKSKSTFISFIILLGIAAGLVVLQPDFGTSVVIIAVGLVVYFLAGAPLTHLAILSGGIVAALSLLIKIAPYRLARLTAFLHPEIDPQGISYHINQALLAIGSGGIFGRGLGHSQQKIYYLPEVVSDSIFAVVAEELGFILTVTVVLLYIFLAYRIFKTASSADNKFGFLLASGIGFWFIFQTMVNMAAMLNILPLTGIPLPLISYGGSSLLIFLAAFGIVANISRQT